MTQRGTQSIGRALLLLRTIAHRNEKGVKLSDLAKATNLSVTTVRRILAFLVKEDFANHDPVSKRYRLGAELYLLGNRAEQFSIREACHQTLLELSDITEDTVYLVKRVGNESVCIDRVEGKFPIKIMTYDIGSRRPLGIGTAGLAYLSFMPDHDIEKILKANASFYTHHNNMTAARIKRLIKATRETGYTVNIGNYLKGVTGIGVPLFNERNEVVASICVSSISDRMRPERQAFIAQLLKEKTRTISLTIPP